MAVVTLYFGASAAGASDGTSWANRAAFVSGGAINTLISAFDFTSDTLIARIGPGTHKLTTGIATFTGTATPSLTFPCVLEGALSDGSRWQPPDPDWCSAQPAWDADDATYPMPVIATTTNIITINNAAVSVYGIKFTASGRNGNVINAARWVEWLHVINSTSNSAAVAMVGVQIFANNCYCSCSGTSYANVIGTNGMITYNVRAAGNLSATTGTRYGWANGQNNWFHHVKMTIIDNVGGGFIASGTGTSTRVLISNSVIADNNADGISSAGTSSSLGYITNCMITGAHANAINMTGSGDVVVANCRMRDYTSNDIAGTLDWNDPPLNGNVNTAGTDADEYVDQASGDYRIKNTSSYWGKGYGAGDEPAAGGGGGPLVGGRLVQ